MATRTRKVKSNPQLRTKGPANNPQLSAIAGSMGVNLIGANIGSLSQDRDLEEMAQAKNNMREKAKAKKLVGEVSLGPTTVIQEGYHPQTIDGKEQFQQKPLRKRKVKTKK